MDTWFNAQLDQKILDGIYYLWTINDVAGKDPLRDVYNYFRYVSPGKTPQKL